LNSGFNIVDDFMECNGGWDKFARFITFKVGNGARTRFWRDTWCGDSPFKTIFPDLYGIARDKEAFLAAHLQLRNDSIHWELNFIRAAHDWELESFSTFFDLLYLAKVLGQGEDKIFWKASSTKEFKVRLYYQALDPSVGCFPWKSTWHAKVAPRVAFFTWLASLGKVLTVDNLETTKYYLGELVLYVQSRWGCCMCKVDWESVDHLFLHCALARELWTMVFSLFGMHWVMPRRIVDVLACWQGRLGRHKNWVLWNAIPHCVLWCIWRERNDRTFEGCERNILDLKILLLRTLFDWMTATSLFSFSNFLEFLDYCFV
jgi:hypothetical protein